MKIIAKNKTKFDCGIVAAHNAASWCNVHKKYSEIEKIAKSCGYNPNKGMYPFQFDNLLKKLKVPVKKIKLKSLRQLKNKLYLGKLFIFLYKPNKESNGHIIAVFLNHHGKIQIVNPDIERLTWIDFIEDISNNGMVEFISYEIPQRKLVKK